MKLCVCVDQGSIIIISQFLSYCFCYYKFNTFIIWLLRIFQSQYAFALHGMCIGNIISCSMSSVISIVWWHSESERSLFSKTTCK